MRLRTTRPEDGARIWRLVQQAGSLELNSAYAYVLLATHFSDTCLIAEEGDELIGMVIAYRPPRRSEAVFVWQVAVAPAGRGRGLGRRLLLELAARTAPHGVRFVEASVTPGNAPSRALFESLARELGTECRVQPFMTPELFPEPHEAEELFRIGPFAAAGNATDIAPALGRNGSTSQETTRETTR